MNRVTDVLGIEYPVIQGAMAGISDSKLVAAVSEAGGLGTLQSVTFSEEEFEREIEKVRELTSKPFTINFPIARGEKSEKLLDIALDKELDIVCVSAGDPKPFLDKLEDVKVCMQVVPSAKLAKKMEDYGFNIVIVEGDESGGLISPNGVSTLSLVRNAVDKVDLPVIAAGGIVDKQTAISMKKLGAEGVQLGTRFLASEECNIPETVKGLLVEKNENDIVKIRHGKTASNVIVNEYVRELLNESEDRPIISWKERLKKSKAGRAGDIENGLIYAGQSIGQIKEVKTVKEIVNEIGKAFLEA